MATAVTAVEIDQLNAMVADIPNGNRHLGTLVMGRLCEIARDLTRWQYVIHGQTDDYRAGIVRWLCRKDQFNQARRFALCGRGDLLGRVEGTAKAVVKPMGCGARYCPRCSRKYGRKYLRRVQEHLSHAEHGLLMHIVFTQPALSGEPLEQTRARFQKSWHRMNGTIKRQKMSAGLATYHLKRTDRNAWHWHCHMVAEFPAGANVDEVLAAFEKAWHKAQGLERRQMIPLWGRKIADAGPALSGLKGDGQGELWRESDSAVERCLQYVLRDVLQGVETWITEAMAQGDIEAFAEGVSRAKMHRLFGRWRKKCETTEKATDADAASKTADQTAPPAAPNVEKVTWLGTVDKVMWEAFDGVTESAELLGNLVHMYSNRSLVSQRLRMVLK